MTSKTVRETMTLEVPVTWKAILELQANRRGSNVAQLMRDAIWMWMGHEGVRPK